ncbi:MAG TPA: anaerobic ribonucleoside-triphosphate reductase activating protein [Chromobacteriaceae bacterium]|nr:anaerobic ribonucleoside-triphosphate reductase activating protein [Chromobacteriaceae bacterium]
MPNSATEANALCIGGITPFSATDYPGKLSAVVFVQGCPWRCHYCHNPHLQPRATRQPVAWARFFDLLQRRSGLIDAVVFSGGEPTLDPALPAAMAEVRRMGFLVGLHSGGIYPARFAEVLKLADWVGLDIKTNFDDYETITGVASSGAPAREALTMLLDSGVAYECRTTLHPSLHTNAQVTELAHKIAAMGVRHYALQCFRIEGTKDHQLAGHLPADYPDTALVAQLRQLFDTLIVRKAD